MIEVTLKEPEALDIKVSEASVIEIEAEDSDVPEVEIQLEGEMVPLRNYPQLYNKPKINGVEVVGDKVSSDYGLQGEMQFATNLDIDKLFKG